MNDKVKTSMSFQEADFNFMSVAPLESWEVDCQAKLIFIIDRPAVQLVLKLAGLDNNREKISNAMISESDRPESRPYYSLTVFSRTKERFLLVCMISMPI